MGVNRVTTDDPTYIGPIVDVEGSTVRIRIDPSVTGGLKFVEGRGYRLGQPGSFVKIPLGFNELFGVVVSVGAGSAPKNVDAEEYGERWMSIELLGEKRGPTGFSRGVSEYPTIGDEAYLVTRDDLAKIYSSSGNEDEIEIGHLSGSPETPAYINLNKLVSRHCAVLGATGSGKSTTVSRITESIACDERFPSSRVIIIDIHGEYTDLDIEGAETFSISHESQQDAKPLYVPYWAMEFERFLNVTLGDLEGAERQFVREYVAQFKEDSVNNQDLAGIDESTLTVDSAVPFSVHDLWYQLHRDVYATHTVAGGQTRETEAIKEDQHGNPLEGDPMEVEPPEYKPHTATPRGEGPYLAKTSVNLSQNVDSLAGKLRDPRYEFLFRPGPWGPDSEGEVEEDLDTLLEQWLGGPQKVSVLDLSDVPDEVLDTVVGAVLNLIFDALYWSQELPEGGRKRPLTVVLEEAHRYLGVGKGSPASMAASRLVREGRKYGLGVLLVSQRPEDIDSDMLSQCGSVIAMRMKGGDVGEIKSRATDSLSQLVELLPTLRVGEAIVLGEIVQIPMRAKIHQSAENRRPTSDDPLVVNEKATSGWNSDLEDEDYERVLVKWRGRGSSQEIG
jgi:hypothetical protein